VRSGRIVASALAMTALVSPVIASGDVFGVVISMEFQIDKVLFCLVQQVCHTAFPYPD